MKDLLKAFFIVMIFVSGAKACEINVDNCTAMTEPCEPIDLCAEPCDSIAD